MLQLGIERTSTPDLRLTATAVALETQAARLATQITASPTPVLTITPRITETAMVSATPTVTPTPTRTNSLACPTDFAGYPDAIAAYLNDPGASPDGLATWLRGCGVISDDLGGVYQHVIQGGPTPDVVAVIHNMAAAPGPEGILLAYHTSPNGYFLAYQAQAERIELLKVDDVNADGRQEIVWTSTSCGAHTCSSRLFVDRWDGASYQDWIVNTPEMASADYSIADTVPNGSGREILVQDGVVNSAGAGPQRAWTETYISPAGSLYELFSKVYDPSNCLYHHILDANERFTQGAVNGYGPAVAAYQAAMSDPNLGACHYGGLPDELATLRDFARLRLVVAYTAEDNSRKPNPFGPKLVHQPCWLQPMPSWTVITRAAACLKPAPTRLPMQLPTLSPGSS
jgi:hypothetical protein